MCCELIPPVDASTRHGLEAADQGGMRVLPRNEANPQLPAVAASTHQPRCFWSPNVCCSKIFGSAAGLVDMLARWVPSSKAATAAKVERCYTGARCAMLWINNSSREVCRVPHLVCCLQPFNAPHVST